MLDDNLEAFEYVVERKKPARICFGSTLPRNTDLLSPFQSRYKYEFNPDITPQTYHLENTENLYLLQNKVRSNRGVVGLVNRAPRFPQTKLARFPSPTRYDVKLDYNEPKPSTVPFRSQVERKPFPDSTTPAPGQYTPALPRCLRTKFQYNFGVPKMEAAVPVKCRPEPLDACAKCARYCDGDYWTLNTTTFLCHPCMLSERTLHELFNRSELKRFQKIRTCTFKHRHEETTASIKLLTQTRIMQREQRENYLSVFLAE